MSILKTVGMELIHPNPFRMLDNYPWIEEKLESLKRSIEDVGFWEGVIARPNPKGNGYQIAFGHHRIEAAKRAGLNKADLIVRNLTDEQMIQFMGRENGEDYRADFLTMLNTWEGAISYSGQSAGKSIDIAKLLGWTLIDNGPKAKKGAVMMNSVAKACANAYKLISEGHMAREDFTGMSVSAVRDLTARTQARINDTQNASAKKKLTPAQTKSVVKKIISSARDTAEESRSGDVLQKDIAKTVDKKIKRKAAYFAVPSPEFHKIAVKIATRLDGVLLTDAAAELLEETEEVLQHITSQQDRDALTKLDDSLRRLSERANAWRGRLSKKPKTVTLAAIGADK